MSKLPYNVMRHNDWDKAPRDPISIGTAIASALGLGTVGTFVAIAATYVGISLVTSWALSALTPKPRFGDLTSRGLLVNAKDPISPHDFVYGEVRKGGVVTYYETTGPDNKFLHQIIVLAGHQVEAINDIYLNDEVVTLDGNGFVTSGPWNSKVRIKKALGTPNQLADPDLLAESNEITSNFRGRNIAYLYVRYEYDQDVFANGLPLVTGVVRGKRVFDPRINAFAFTDNAALIVRDYITSDFGLNDAEVDDTVFSAAANICDESVPLAAGGTEKRYTINGVVQANQNHGDVLQNMMTACAASLFWGAGKWKLSVGSYVAPVKNLTLNDLRSPIRLSTRVNLQDQFNGVQGTFSNAEERWLTSDYPPVRSTAFVAEDGGQETLLDFTLPFTTLPATAQRLAKQTLFRGREQMTLTAEFGLNAFDVEVGEIITFTNPRYGFNQKEFEVVGWSFGAADAGDLRVTLTMRETSEAAFDWNAEEVSIIQNNTTLPSLFAGLNVTDLEVIQKIVFGTGGAVVPVLEISWTGASSIFVDRYEITITPFDGAVPLPPFTIFSKDTLIEVPALGERFAYDVSVRAVTVFGNGGPAATFLVNANQIFRLSLILSSRDFEGGPKPTPGSFPQYAVTVDAPMVIRQFLYARSPFEFSSGNFAVVGGWTGGSSITFNSPNLEFFDEFQSTITTGPFPFSIIYQFPTTTFSTVWGASGELIARVSKTYL